MASTMTAIPISAHSTPLLPSQVTALTMPIATAWPATRLFSRAAAPWSADSSGAHCSRTRTSRSAKTNAAAVTTASGARVRLAAADMALLLPIVSRFILFAGCLLAALIRSGLPSPPHDPVAAAVLLADPSLLTRGAGFPGATGPVVGVQSQDPAEATDGGGSARVAGKRCHAKVPARSANRH